MAPGFGDGPQARSCGDSRDDARSLRGGADKAEALAAFARRDQPPEDRAAGRAHEMRVWATDDVFTALTLEAREAAGRCRE